MEREKKKINWRRTVRNNGYMLGLVVKACPGILIVSVAEAIFNAMFAFVSQTYLYQYALNALQEGKQVKEIIITLCGMTVYAVFCIVFTRFCWCYNRIKMNEVEAYLQTLLQKKAVEADLACFEQSDFYDTYVKACQVAGGRAMKVVDNVCDVLWCIVYLGVTSALLVTIDPVFVLLALSPLVCQLVAGRYRNRVSFEYNMKKEEVERQKDYVRRTFYLNDFSKEMRLTQMWRVLFRRMHDNVAKMKTLVRKYGVTLMWLRCAFECVTDIVVTIGAIILAAFKTLVAGTMLVGDCFVVINSMELLAMNFNYIGKTMLTLDENSLYIENLRSFLEYDIRIRDVEDAPEAPSLQVLELRKVGFAYGETGHFVLRNVDLSIRAEEKIAIVGHNGAGKTTLIKLLQRLYDPTEGEIRLNSENIRNYRLSTYRKLFGTVFQDYGLFATSVAENVLMRGGITDEDRETVKNALKRSGIYDKVESLPQGVDTMVTKEFDSEGAAFSGGEEQKIAIARIFAGDHEVVIMDEPTSALDPIAEQEMYRNMFEACEGKTVIFISHRLSSATMADRVYLFEQGEIIEQGSHRELLALGGKYADMWHKQADTYLAEEVAG